MVVTIDSKQLSIVEGMEPCSLEHRFEIGIGRMLFSLVEIQREIGLFLVREIRWFNGQMVDASNEVLHRGEHLFWFEGPAAVR